MNRRVRRLFGVRRCGRCQAAISPSELVMRARETVFHVPCFSCTVCMAVLTKGDQFGMRDGAVFCQHHYQQYGPSSASTLGQQQQQQQQQLSPQLRSIMPPSMTPTLAAVQSPYPSSRTLESPGPVFFNGSGAAGGNATAAPAPTQPRQKGRPRKRKPKDLDIMTANMGKSADFLNFPLL